MNLQLWSFVVSVSILNVSQSLDYSDVEALGLNCHDKFSCESPTRTRDSSNFRDFYSRSCECDSQCAVYGDCCVDADERRVSRPKGSFTCMPFGGNIYLGVYVVSRCPRRWDGPVEVKTLCEEGDSLRDPLNAAPQTNIAQGRTYRNRYCAECNAATPSSLVTWLIGMECSSLPLNVSNANVWNNLEWSEGTRQWGVYRWNPSNSKQDFYPCSIRFDMPHSVNDSVRLCRPKLVSTCPNSWRRGLVRRQCAAYTAVVFKGSVLLGYELYRNPHCAICNGLSVDEFSCADGLSSRHNRPLSFAMLLDINQSDGDKVGVSRQVTPRCPSGQKYDPFFKKCRALVCALPGFRMVNGKCVQG